MRLLHYKPHVPNFGDDLNARLWPELAPSLFERGPMGEAFVGIGTIIGIDPGADRTLHVFSSGAGYTSADRWKGLDVRYHCVRGPVTARVLGLEDAVPLTDGAILAPVAEEFRFAPSQRSPSPVVVVPHFETIAFPGWAEAVAFAGFDLIDPRGTPETVIAALAGASLVLTESLHGAILADAYGVPWRPFAVSRNFSMAKWTDWACSLALDVEVAVLPPPDPMPLLRFGKRHEPFGTMVRLDPEAAVAEFTARIAAPAPTPFVKRQAKRMLQQFPAARRVLGFSPQRTAQALSDLADMPPYCSREDLRERLRSQMLDRLDSLVKENARAPAVSA